MVVGRLRMHAGLARFCVAAVTACALMALALPAYAEVAQSVEIDAQSTLSRTGSDNWNLAGFATTQLQLYSVGNRYVKGELAIDATVGGDTTPASAAADSPEPNVRFDIPRAYIKVRFPLSEALFYHVTAGKARITWGNGSLFNAGNLIFGATATNPDFTAGTIRDDTAWLIALFLPVSTYTFFEPVVLFPGVDLSGSAAPPTDPLDSAAGMRFHTQIGSTKTELAYLYNGVDRLHEAAVSVQGHLLVDWYTAVNSEVPVAGTSASDAFANLAVSIGLLHIAQFTGGSSLSLRLEALLRPDAYWSEQAEAGTDYGISLFPEVVWSPVQSVNIYLRSVVSPVDLSAMIIPGLSWSIYDGFTFNAFATVMAGEIHDAYGLGQTGGVQLATSVSFIY